VELPIKCTGNIDNAKKEERESGGIPEEESGTLQIEIETARGIGEIQSPSQEKILCKQRRAA
jgi:hypothetical protein